MRQKQKVRGFCFGKRCDARLLLTTKHGPLFFLLFPFTWCQLHGFCYFKITWCLSEPQTPKCPHQHVGMPFLQGLEPPSILTVWLPPEQHQTSRASFFPAPNTSFIPLLKPLSTSHTTLISRGCGRISLFYRTFLCRWNLLSPAWQMRFEVHAADKQLLHAILWL